MPIDVTSAYRAAVERATEVSCNTTASGPSFAAVGTWS
jgi:hypothetical protein